jgi:hypothetical protein
MSEHETSYLQRAVRLDFSLRLKSVIVKFRKNLIMNRLYLLTILLITILTTPMYAAARESKSPSEANETLLVFISEFLKGGQSEIGNMAQISDILRGRASMKRASRTSLKKALSSPPPNCIQVGCQTLLWASEVYSRIAQLHSPTYLNNSHFVSNYAPESLFLGYLLVSSTEVDTNRPLTRLLLEFMFEKLIIENAENTELLLLILAEAHSVFQNESNVHAMNRGLLYQIINAQKHLDSQNNGITASAQVAAIYQFSYMAYSGESGKAIDFIENYLADISYFKERLEFINNIYKTHMALHIALGSDDSLNEFNLMLIRINTFKGSPMVIDDPLVHHLFLLKQSKKLTSRKWQMKAFEHFSWLYETDQCSCTKEKIGLVLIEMFPTIIDESILIDVLESMDWKQDLNANLASAIYVAAKRHFNSDELLALRKKIK